MRLTYAVSCCLLQHKEGKKNEEISRQNVLTGSFVEGRNTVNRKENKSCTRERKAKKKKKKTAIKKNIHKRVFTALRGGK